VFINLALENIVRQSSIIDQVTKDKLIYEAFESIIKLLTEGASKISVENSSILAIGWFNGRRTPDANQLLKGTITGLNLGSSAPLIFRALVESTAFGSKAIMDSFLQQDIEIERVIAIGGISLKFPFVMQILSDVLGLPIKVAKSERACALGEQCLQQLLQVFIRKLKQHNNQWGRDLQKNIFPTVKII
jgi:L-ribulokinase